MRARVGLHSSTSTIVYFACVTDCSDSAVLYDSADDYGDVEAGDHLFTDDEEEVE